MNLHPALYATLLLSLAAPAVYADVCVVPGDIVIEDPAADVIGSPVPPDPVTDVADLLALSVATPAAASVAEQTVVFTINTSGTAPGFPPRAAIYTSFADPKQVIRGVRMEGTATGGFTYYSYEAAPSGGLTPVTDGRFVKAGSQIPAEGTYAGGVITITVKATDIGISGAGDVLSGFNGATVLRIGSPVVPPSPAPDSGAASLLDAMPDDIQDRTVAMPFTYSPCAKSAKAADGQGSVEDKSGTNFGGALAPWTLMLLALLSRRRIA